MKSKTSLIGLATLFLSVTALAQNGSVPSRPDKATIYRDGYALLEQKLSPKDARSAILLPPGVDMASVRVIANGRPFAGLQFEELIEEIVDTERSVVQGVVVERPRTTKKPVGYLLRLDPSASANKGGLTLRYGSSGLSWQPELGAEIIDGKRVSVSLTALVNNTALDLRDCQIQLASSAGQLPSKVYFATHHALGNVSHRSADMIYTLGKRTILKDRPALLTVLTANGSYTKKLIWQTDTRERVRTVLMIPNPFEQALCPTPARLYRRGALISQDNAEWAEPGAPILLAAGHAADVLVERSVDTTENLANRARPFRHQLKFKVTNRGTERIQLEVIMNKKLGHSHKTLYKFKQEPDRRPGALFIWDLNLTQGKTGVIAFRIDSEYARFSGYETYEKARYEMH